MNEIHLCAFFNELFVHLSNRALSMSFSCFYRNNQPIFRVDNPLEMFTLNRHNEQLPRYLFLAMEMSTNVFEFKKSTVDALDRPIFSTHETTILVGKLKNGEIVVQVTSIFFVIHVKFKFRLRQ
jgi:hypothetical protein